MDEKRVEALSPYFRRYALDRKQDIEMVFHPGQTLKSEIGREYTKQGFIDDHLSANRSMEKKTIMQKIVEVMECYERKNILCNSLL